MKRLWFIAILATFGSACVEGNNQVLIGNAFPIATDTCERDDQVSIISGTLNFNIRQSYTTTFTLTSPLDPEVTGTDNVGFRGEAAIFSYQAMGSPVSTLSFEDESLPIHFVVPAGADGTDAWIALNLIGTKAREKLNGDGVVPVAPASMTLLVTLKLAGKLGTGKEVETNEVTYPIEISRAPCPGGGTPTPLVDPENPCAFPGQDRFYSAFICG